MHKINPPFLWDEISLKSLVSLSVELTGELFWFFLCNVYGFCFHSMVYWVGNLIQVKLFLCPMLKYSDTDFFFFILAVCTWVSGRRWNWNGLKTIKPCFQCFKTTCLLRRTSKCPPPWEKGAFHCSKYSYVQWKDSHWKTSRLEGKTRQKFMFDIFSWDWLFKSKMWIKPK